MKKVIITYSHLVECEKIVNIPNGMQIESTTVEKILEEISIKLPNENLEEILNFDENKDSEFRNSDFVDIASISIIDNLNKEKQYENKKYKKKIIKFFNQNKNHESNSNVFS